MIARRTLLLQTVIVAAVVVVACVVVLLALSQKKAEAAFPGGNGYIAFSSYRPVPGGPCCSTTEIYRVGADGSGLTRLTDPPSVSGVGDWSADGSKIVFIRCPDQSHTDSCSIYTMDADGQNQVEVFALPDGQYGGPQWFPSGKKLAFAAAPVGGGDYNLYVLSLGSDGKALGKPTRLTHNPSPDWMPDVSPNGKKIAFVSPRHGTSNDIYVIRAGAPEGPDNPAKPLVALNGRDESPSWSPDGKKVAFQKYKKVAGLRGRIHSNVYVVNADGSGMTKLTHRSDNYAPVFSPNGRWLLFNRVRPQSGAATSTDGVDLWKMRANGKHKQLLVENARGGIWQPLP